MDFCCWTDGGISTQLHSHSDVSVRDGPWILLGMVGGGEHLSILCVLDVNDGPRLVL